MLLVAFLIGCAAVELALYLLLPSHPFLELCFTWWFFGGAFFTAIQELANIIVRRRYREREIAESE